MILSFVVKDVPRETQISIKWEKMGPKGMFSNARLQHSYDGGISYVGSNLSLWTKSFVLTI